jgi:hypothetical protein
MRNKRLEENKMRHRNEKRNLFMRTATSGWALSEIDKEQKLPKEYGALQACRT